MLTAINFETGQRFYFSEGSVENISVYEGKIKLILKGNPGKPFICSGDITPVTSNMYYEDLMKNIKE